MSENGPRQYKCLNCGEIYDEAIGCPDLGIPPSTPWGDLPDDWVCPRCGSDKRDFVVIA
jgi:rubredoxin